MRREAINPFDYGTHILTALRGGLLLTTLAGERVNTMTISWGTLGIDWQNPVFTVFVRKNRFTRSLLDANPQFTINIPYGDFDRRILGVAGTRSGRDFDKIAHLGLRLVEPEKISAPAVLELPMTLECAVVYRQPQELPLLEEGLREANYPQHIDGSAPGLNRDAHIAYSGAIVAAYILRP